jgi:hypothetical protein
VNGTHIHLAITDLSAALEWVERVWELKPVFQLPQMAILPFGAVHLFLDRADHDSPATIGYDSDNCDRDFAAVVSRGAVARSAPEDKPWGVRAAYVQGPGALIFEIEQALRLNG